MLLPETLYEPLRKFQIVYPGNTHIMPAEIVITRETHFLYHRDHFWSKKGIKSESGVYVYTSHDASTHPGVTDPCLLEAHEHRGSQSDRRSFLCFNHFH